MRLKLLPTRVRGESHQHTAGVLVLVLSEQDEGHDAGVVHHMLLSKAPAPHDHRGVLQGVIGHLGAR